MQRILGPGANLHALSAISDDPRFDEQPFIDRMGAYLQCPVSKVALRFGPAQCLQLLEQAIYHNDEPVGDLSNVAHFLLMQRARELGVTVILSGQGADELLCGYRKYLGFYLESLVRSGRFTKALWTLAQFLGRGNVIAQFRFSEARRYLPGFLAARGFDIRGRMLREDGGFAVDVGLGAGNLVMRQIADLERFSLPALVHYEDRMSMAWSREIRLPFLDFRLVHLLLPLDVEWKLGNGWTKHIFRTAMEPYLPPEIAWRKDKQGFINPQGEWFKYELRDTMQRLLNERWLVEEAGLIDGRALRAAYQVYCRQPASGGKVGFKDIFAPLALELWARTFQSSLNLN
jgi:asparagine synthase (glutamine-hydrolysing)